MLQIIHQGGDGGEGIEEGGFGLGTTSISLSLIACQPRMLEPSKPRPSSKTSSTSLPTGMVKCCHKAGKSIESEIDRFDFLFAAEGQNFFWESLFA